MKRITVGRANDCDITIVDDTDNVSRHHLVISFNFMGKMKVSDTSSNGTFINGNRMHKGVSISVTPEDKIRMGRNINLDWNLVKDPYRSLRIILVAAICAIALAGIGIGIWSWNEERKKSSEKAGTEVVTPEIKQDDNWTKDSTAKVAPTVTSIDVKGKKNALIRKK